MKIDKQIKQWAQMVNESEDSNKLSEAHSSEHVNYAQMHRVYDRDDDANPPDAFTLGELKKLWKNMKLNDDTYIRFVDPSGMMTNWCIGSMYYSEGKSSINRALEKAFGKPDVNYSGTMYIQLDDFSKYDAMDIDASDEEEDDLIG